MQPRGEPHLARHRGNSVAETIEATLQIEWQRKLEGHGHSMNDPIALRAPAV